MNDVNKTAPYSVGIIGCGNIGFLYDHGKTGAGVYTHFRAFALSPFFRITGVAEPHAHIRQAITAEYGIAAFEQYTAMLDTTRPDVVCIAAPDVLHAEMLRACVAYRPKLVFCEKPLAGTRQEAEEIVALYREQGIGLQINFTRRFLEEYRALAGWVQSSDAGSIQNALIYYSRGLVHNGSHYIDAILHLLGEPADVRVVRQREGLIENDPTVSVVFGYDNFDVYLAGMQTGTLLTNEIDIIGTNGRIQIDTDGVITRSTVQRHPFYAQYTHFSAAEQMRIDTGKALPNAVANLYGFLESREPLLSPGDNSIRVFQLIDRIQEQL